MKNEQSIHNDFYIYVYLDPRSDAYDIFDHIPFYIGRGRRSRDLFHLNEAKKLQTVISFDEMKNKRLNMLKINKIRKILSLGLEPIILKIEENLSLEKSKNLEIYWIKHLGRCFDGSGVLTNLTSGGEGRVITHAGPFNPFYKKTHSIETKEKISKIHKNKIISQEQKLKISQALKKPKSKEARESYSRSMKNRAKNPNDPSIKARRESRTKKWILQMPNSDIIEVDSLRNFSKENNLNVKSIMNTIKTKCPISRGSSMGWMIISKSNDFCYKGKK